jgi:hypothetical protein
LVQRPYCTCVAYCAADTWDLCEKNKHNDLYCSPTLMLSISLSLFSFITLNWFITLNQLACFLFNTLFFKEKWRETMN